MDVLQKSWLVFIVVILVLLSFYGGLLHCNYWEFPSLAYHALSQSQYVSSMFCMKMLLILLDKIGWLIFLDFPKISHLTVSITFGYLWALRMSRRPTDPLPRGPWWTRGLCPTGRKMPCRSGEVLRRPQVFWRAACAASWRLGKPWCLVTLIMSVFFWGGRESIVIDRLYIHTYL